MKYRRLDANGDMNFGHGAADFATGQEAVAQAIKTRLKWYWNEWWERQNDGFPMFQQVATYGAMQNKVDLLFADWIKGTEGVTGVQSLTSKVENRQYSMSSIVNTVYGAIPITYPLEAA